MTYGNIQKKEELAMKISERRILLGVFLLSLIMTSCSKYKSFSKKDFLMKADEDASVVIYHKEQDKKRITIYGHVLPPEQEGVYFKKMSPYIYMENTSSILLFPIKFLDADKKTEFITKTGVSEIPKGAFIASFATSDIPKGNPYKIGAAVHYLDRYSFSLSDEKIHTFELNKKFKMQNDISKVGYEVKVFKIEDGEVNVYGWAANRYWSAHSDNLSFVFRNLSNQNAYIIPIEKKESEYMNKQLSKSRRYDKYSDFTLCMFDERIDVNIFDPGEYRIGFLLTDKQNDLLSYYVEYGEEFTISHHKDEE